MGEIYEIVICNDRGEIILDCHTAFSPREKEILAKEEPGTWYGAGDQLEMHVDEPGQ